MMQLSQCHPLCQSSIKPHSTPCFGFHGDNSKIIDSVKKECTRCGYEWTAPILGCPQCGPLQDVLPTELQGEFVSTPSLSVTITGSPDQVIDVIQALKGLS